MKFVVLVLVMAMASMEEGSELLSHRVLGPGDQIVLKVLDLDENGDPPVLVDRGGYVTLPIVGKMRAGGLTVEQLESAVEERLGTVLQHPDVTIVVKGFI